MGCHPNSRTIEPSIYYLPGHNLIGNLPDAFPPLTPQERSQEWGREFFLGKHFAKEVDLYRALTCFKRALFLIPLKCTERRLEIEYEIFLAYYVGNKFQDAVDAFERGRLMDVPESFPALNELKIALYDAYTRNNQCERANRILNLIATSNEELAENLLIERAIVDADFTTMMESAEQKECDNYLSRLLFDYSAQAKSVSKAQTLNAIFPGAGYAYVGQEKAALTSFLINTLFIAASYQLFNHGYIAAGIITTGLEVGWYFGGINGAGLAAKEYNERLYERVARDTLIDNRLFPVLMLEKAF